MFSNSDTHFFLNQKSFYFTQTPNLSPSHLDGIFWGEAVFRLFHKCSVSKEKLWYYCYFLSFLHSSSFWSLSDLSISVSKDIHQFYYWNGSFSIPPDHNIFLLIIIFYILVFSVFLGWQYMFFFSSGQSNPTFCLSKNGKKFVLRKKPPGKLLRGAHQVCLVHTLYPCSLIS